MSFRRYLPFDVLSFRRFFLLFDVFSVDLFFPLDVLSVDIFTIGVFYFDVLSVNRYFKCSFRENSPIKYFCTGKALVGLGAKHNVFVDIVTISLAQWLGDVAPQ